MNDLVALLGNTPLLSLAELQATLKDDSLERFSDHAVFFSFDYSTNQEIRDLQNKLGGVFKIMKVVSRLSDNSDQALIQVTDYLFAKGNKVTFGLTSLDQKQLSLSCARVKSQLKERGVSVRFIDAQNWGLSAAILSHHNDVLDLFIVKYKDEYLLLETVAVQDVDSWVTRDRDKPYVSGKRGMLPPKVARMIVNLGLGKLENRGDERDPVLYDPFCGTGTILIEGVLRGCSIIGSDLDIEAVEGTKKNLNWFDTQFDLNIGSQIFQADATQVHSRSWDRKVDLIVTEPFLGKPNPEQKEINNIFNGLEALYLGAFKSWLSILRKGSVIAIIFPQVTFGKEKYHLLKIIDKLERFGYTLLTEPIDYSQPSALVKRQVFVFRYH